LAKFLGNKVIKQASKRASSKAAPKTDDEFESLLERLANAEQEVGTRKHH
jgi:hypothetical protein